MTRFWSLIFATLFAARAIAADATPEPTLKVGSPAPALTPGKWVKGEPLKEFAHGTVYLIEFWASWCGPCLQTVPHLSELQDKYQSRGLIIVGQDVWDEDDADALKFIRERGNKMRYRVTLDDKKDGKDEQAGKMSAAWMKASGRTTLPTAFLITKSGQVAWIGNPLLLKTDLLEAVLADKFDIKKAADEYEQRVAMDKQATSLWDDVNKAITDKQWDKVESGLDQLEKIANPQSADEVFRTRMNTRLKRKEYSGALDAAKRFSKEYADEAAYHSEIAFQLAMQPYLTKDLLDFALEEGNRAKALSNGKNPDFLDTLARVLFVRGDKAGAIATEQQAIDLAEPKDKKTYQKTLDAYKAGKLPGE